MERHSSTLRIHHYHHHHQRRRHRHYHEKSQIIFFLSNWVALLCRVSSMIIHIEYAKIWNYYCCSLFSAFFFCFPHWREFLGFFGFCARSLNSFFSKATELHSCLKQSEFPFSFITHTDYLNKRFCFLFPLNKLQNPSAASRAIIENETRFSPHNSISSAILWPSFLVITRITFSWARNPSIISLLSLFWTLFFSSSFLLLLLSSYLFSIARSERHKSGLSLVRFRK